VEGEQGKALKMLLFVFIPFIIHITVPNPLAFSLSLCLCLPCPIRRKLGEYGYEWIVISLGRKLLLFP